MAFSNWTSESLQVLAHCLETQVKGRKIYTGSFGIVILVESVEHL